MYLSLTRRHPRLLHVHSDHSAQALSRQLICGVTHSSGKYNIGQVEELLLLLSNLWSK
jgi:hypothetical protein